MADREDIDALLISALYGELTPADEARLDAHLASHPADRAALEGMTLTRTRLRESRILEHQVEPPASMSAVLMQEAARRAPARAPAPGEGWFARFVRSFMMHPAMAAAAMLVVVVGAAAIISRGTGARPELAQTTAPAEQAAPAAAPRGAAQMDPAAAAGSASAEAQAAALADTPTADQFQVALDEGGAAPRDSAAADRVASRAGKGGGGVASGGEGRAQLAGAKETEAKPLAVADRSKAKAERSRGIELTTSAPEPKDFDARKADAEGDGAYAREEIAGGAAPAPEAAVTGYAAPPPPPAPVAQAAPAPKKTAAKPTAPAASAPARRAPADDAAPDPALAWARQRHAAAVSAARSGDCATAGRLAASIAAQAPAYYGQSVATDRELKSCATYIAAERKRLEAEKARATTKPATATDAQ